MEHFSFEQLLGFLVFLIVAISKVWTSLRDQTKQKPPSSQQKPVLNNPQTVFEKPLEDLLEALGLPTQKQSLPQPKVKPMTSSSFTQPKKVFTKPIALTQKPIAKPFLSLDQPAIKHVMPVVKSVSYPSPNRWQNLLKDRHQIQQAILMNEILGKPKGLTYLGS